MPTVPVATDRTASAIPFAGADADRAASARSSPRRIACGSGESSSGRGIRIRTWTRWRSVANGASDVDASDSSSTGCTIESPSTEGSGSCAASGSSDRSASSPRLLVYHERQREHLCGLHAVNNLMQYAAMTEQDIRGLARRLDKEEKRLLAHRKRNRLLYMISLGTRGWKYESASNQTCRGDFSVQVLQAALKSVGAEMLSPGDMDTRSPWGIVVNFNGHWSAYRRIEDMWFDVDSLLDRPRFVTAREVKVLLALASKPVPSGPVVFCVVSDRVPAPPPPFGRTAMTLTEVPVHQREDSADTDGVEKTSP